MIQYTSATDTSTADAGIKMWIDPDDGDAAPDFEILTTAGSMGSFNGDGTFGRYMFGAYYFNADANGPDVWMNRIGTWGGFGEVGVCDLASAVQFLYANVSVDLKTSTPSSVEGDSTTNNLSFSLKRRGDEAVPGDIQWSVVATGTDPVSRSDFPGGVLPSGTLSFGANETTKVLQIPISPDLVPEENETMEIQFNTSLAVFRLDQTSLFATIVNDDTPPTTNVSLNGSGDLVIEDTSDASNDTLMIKADLTNAKILISDPNHSLSTAIPGATGSGTHEVSVPIASITGTAISVLPGDGNDTLTVDLSLGDFSMAITYAGGNPTSGSGDLLNLAGGSRTTGTFTYTIASDGTVNFDGQTFIAYTGLEPINCTVALTHARFNHSASADAITLSTPSSGVTLIDSTFGEATTLSHPTSTLTVEAGGGADTITITSLEADCPASVTLDGQSDSDTITSNVAVNLAGSATLTTKAEIVVCNAPGTQVTSDSWVIGGGLSLDDQNTLTFVGDLSFAASSTLHLRLPSTSSDQVQVLGGGAVDLSNATLQLTVPTAPVVGTAFTIVDCEPGTILTAPFASVSEGGQVSAGSSVFQLTYVGGDGNDIVLTTLLDYEQWEIATFHSTPTASSYQDPTGNPDDDALPNGLEYLLGIDPTTHNDDPLEITVVGEEAKISYPRVSTVPDGLDVVEWSFNLYDWFPLNVTPTRQTLDATRDQVTWTDTIPTNVRVFYRVRTIFP
ncbi:MAG: hypothetical protein ACI8T1_003411 [Verrucomicrobiales bacterium]